ncbi:hypothetical protein D3C76_944570 [compost metagenome]
MAAASALGVEGMDGAVTDGRQGVFDATGLVEGVGVDRHLDVHLLGHAQATVDGRRGRAPVLVQLQAHGTGGDLLAQRLGARRIAFAQQADVDRQAVGRLEHARQVPRPGRAGGGIGAGGRPRAAANEGGYAAGECLLHLLRADEMDVRIDTAGRDDLAFSSNHFGTRANRYSDTRLHIGVAGLANRGNAPVLDADVGLDDPPVVDDQRVGQHQVHGLSRQHLALPHAVTDDLATAKLDLFAIHREVFLDLDPQRGIGQAHAVADGRAEHVGIGATGNTAHTLPSSAPITLPWKPYTSRLPA